MPNFELLKESWRRSLVRLGSVIGDCMEADLKFGIYRFNTAEWHSYGCRLVRGLVPSE
ncbi:hypothetical protein BQ8482_480066 [Mesorhizobium delmotii]|uniref:Uncharacterized protein n=1 Tax=Mesorhizobium delmotii TaxID=1631247 RepID=A0A2P9ATT0_9HYPH|nr:hypothetical protein BQ8482_480066 [Mesorhizobium delmotii]